MVNQTTSAMWSGDVYFRRKLSSNNWEPMEYVNAKAAYDAIAEDLQSINRVMDNSSDPYTRSQFEAARDQLLLQLQAAEDSMFAAIEKYGQTTFTGEDARNWLLAYESLDPYLSAIAEQREALQDAQVQQEFDIYRELDAAAGDALTSVQFIRQDGEITSVQAAVYDQVAAVPVASGGGITAIGDVADITVGMEHVVVPVNATDGMVLPKIQDSAARQSLEIHDFHVTRNEEGNISGVDLVVAPIVSQSAPAESPAAGSPVEPSLQDMGFYGFPQEIAAQIAEYQTGYVAPAAEQVQQQALPLGIGAGSIIVIAILFALAGRRRRVIA